MVQSKRSSKKNPVSPKSGKGSLKKENLSSKKTEVKKKKPFVGFSLVRFPQGVLRDIYGNPEKLVNRMRWVNAEVVSVVDRLSKSSLNGAIVITDTFRLPSESYLARLKKGNMVAPPGLSGHNYGISWDIALEATYKATCKSHSALVTTLGEKGLYPISSEPWHFNLLYRDEREYFFSLYNQLSFLHAKIRKEVVGLYNSLVVPVKSVKDIQSTLGLVVDGIAGRRTIMSVTMLLAEKKGMFKGILDPKVESIKINLVDVWEC